jgi:hypothetical protein
MEAMRLHPRIPCSKGEKGCVGLCWPWSEGEGGSAVQTKKERDPKAILGGGGMGGVDGGGLLPY